MTHKIGTDLGGIRTVEDLKKRCRVDEDTGCWHWTLALCRGVPKVHFRAPDTGICRRARGRRAALYLRRGTDLPDGHIAFARLQCKSADCVNPEHCRSDTKARWGEWLTKSGKVKGLPSKYVGSRKGWDTRGRKLTPEMVAEIRSSAEPHHIVGKRLGVSGYAVWSVRVGLTHRQHMPGASVFGWRPAA